MKELEIGETITIKCVEDKTDDGCVECVFHQRYSTCAMRKEDKVGTCSQYDRTDRQNVHFEIVDTSIEIDTKVANLVSMHLAEERKI